MGEVEGATLFPKHYFANHHANLPFLPLPLLPTSDALQHTTIPKSSQEFTNKPAVTRSLLSSPMQQAGWGGGGVCLCVCLFVKLGLLLFPTRLFSLRDLPPRHGSFHKISFLAAESQPLSPATASRSIETLQIP